MTNGRADFRLLLSTFSKGEIERGWSFVTLYRHLFPIRILIPLLGLFYALPVHALDAVEFLNRIGLYIINPVIYVLFTIAFVVFIWGLVQFTANLNNEEARSTGAKHMLWGIIGMVIMVGGNKIADLVFGTVQQIGQ